MRTALPLALAEAPDPQPAPGDPAIAVDAERERERLRSRLKSIDKRIDKYVDAASKGTLTKEKMRKQGLAAACDRLALEDAIESAERRIDDRSGDAERADARREAVMRLVASWETAPFTERQAALRDAVVRVTVTDDSVAVALRP